MLVTNRKTTVVLTLTNGPLQNLRQNMSSKMRSLVPPSFIKLVDKSA